MLAMLGMAPPVSSNLILPSKIDVSRYLLKFVRAQRASASIVSDRWCVSIIPTSLMLVLTSKEAAADYLREVLIWSAQRYGKGSGLAGPLATPAEEVRHVIGNAIPPRNIGRRSESHLASVVLDLAAYLRLDRLYGLMRNEFRVVTAYPSVITTQDTQGQYELDAADISYEANAPYNEAVPEEWTGVALHLPQAAAARYLQNIGRPWDHFACSAVLRDRHFVSAWSAALPETAIT